MAKAASEPVWDVIVIGGGATGFGTAVEAASRGLKTLLLEKHDFAKGTSSRSTKLVHGGVRYLRQGDISLVRTALRERDLLLKNAPHITRVQPFIIPVYSLWEKIFYGAGMKVYDLLAGRKNIGRSRILSREEVMRQLRMEGSGKQGGEQSIEQGEKLKGGVLYYDGQFDDSRLVTALMELVFRFDGIALNYMDVTGLIKPKKNMGENPDGGDAGKDGSGSRVSGVEVRDAETGEFYKFHAKVVINATGIFADDIRGMDDASTEPMIRTSQGVHLVLDRSFYPADAAMMIPKTSDGRVLFAVPWHEKVILGTTDTPTGQKVMEPRALEEEISYLLEYAGRYLKRAPARSDVLSVFVGLRPLIAAKGSRAGGGRDAIGHGGESSGSGGGGGSGSSSGSGGGGGGDQGTHKKPKHIRQPKTSALSRDHTLFRDSSGLVTITGGKWTTYRHMGQETIDLVLRTSDLKAGPSATAELRIGGGLMPVGHDSGRGEMRPNDKEDLLHPNLPISAQTVKDACRYEMARTVEDVLARRTRCLLLDARASEQVAETVAGLMAKELGFDQEWLSRETEAFRRLAKTYYL